MTWPIRPCAPLTSSTTASLPTSPQLVGDADCPPNPSTYSPAPDATTVVFKLKFPSASLLANLASPWNVIFPKKYLDQDPNYFKTHAIGSGPFKFKGYTRGSTFEGERNPAYFVKDRPYLDG